MEEAIVCDTPEMIDAFRMLSLRGRLKLEIFGMTSRMPTAPVVREIIGSTTKSKEKLLVEFENYLRGKGILKGA